MASEVVVRIVLADDHQLVRAGVRGILERNPRYSVVGEAADGRAAIDLVRQLAPHVLVTDVSMPGMNGIEATRQVAAEFPGTRVIALSMYSDRQFVTGILKAGAAGYLLKNSAASELALAIDAAMSGKTYLCPEVANVVVDDLRHGRTGPDATGPASLTARERQVLQLVAEGRTNKEIAGQLGVGIKTVETHRAQLMDKLKLRTVAELTKYAIRQGITSLE